MPIQNVIVMVDEEPYCFWSLNPQGENLEYLNSINGRYFEDMGNVLLEEFGKREDKLNISTMMRINYYHALETLFSYLCALVQAPDYVVGWIQMASTPNLKHVVARIDSHDDSIKRTLNIDAISWEELAKQVLQASDRDSEQVNLNILKFGEFWNRLASEFLQEASRNEYNAMKHGLRLQSGGYSLSFGPETEPGVLPPPEAMKTLTQSDYGSTFFTAEHCPTNVRKNRSYYLRRQSINWDFEGTAAKLMIIASSIHNVVSFLKILNGIPFDKVQFGRPKNMEIFDLPWEKSGKESSFNLDLKFNKNFVMETTREQLLEIINSNKRISQ